MVKKRGKRWHLRLGVPSDLQPVIGSELSRSLRTSKVREARRLAARIYAEAPQLWNRLRMKTLTPEAVKSMVARWLDERLAAYADPLTSTVALDIGSEEQAEARLEMLQDARERTAAVVAMPSTGYHAPSFVDWISMDASPPADGPEFGYCRQVADQLLREEGLDAVPPELRLITVRLVADAYLKVLGAQERTLRVLNGWNPTPATPAPEKTAVVVPLRPENRVPLLSELCQELLKHRQENRRWTTARDFEGKARVIVKVLGDRQLDEYTHNDLLEAQKVLKKWPRNAALCAREASLQEILKRDDLGDPIGEHTVWNYLVQIASMFRKAQKLGHIRVNPTPDWTEPKANDPIPFSAEQLEKWFTSDYYTVGNATEKPFNYWIPVISLLSGMRVNEICQLYLVDIVESDGVRCFSANEDGDKELKTDNSKRLIPIHPRLLRLGFDKYLAKLKESSQARLWPALNKGKNGKSKYSHYYDKRVNEYLRKHITIGIEKRPTFHSLRRNFAQALRDQAGASEDVIQALLGQDQGGVTKKHYLGKYPAKTLAPFVKKIDFPALDLLPTPWR